MWDELKELLLAFVAALVALWAIVTLVSLSGRLATQDRNSGQKSQDEKPPVDTHASIAADVRDHRPGSVQYEGTPVVASLFISAQAGAPMQEKEQIEAIAHKGLHGDRYCEGCGFWSEKDECQVTIIAQEDLDDMTRETGIDFGKGLHRRNIVTRNIAIEQFVGKRFQIGEAKFAYDRPRPPCLHLQTITGPGVVQAIAGRSGICIRCFHGGVIRQGDEIIPITMSLSGILKTTVKSFWKN